jgi:putative aminopeptidase FrvX
MDQSTYLEIARDILSQPTAPFHESAVRSAIIRQLDGLPGITLSEDKFGNLIALYKNSESAPAFAFAAHMDHPAYVGRKFLGGVPESYRKSKPPTEKFGPFRMWALPSFQLRNGRIFARACDDLIGCACIVATLRELSKKRVKCATYGLFTRAEEVGFVGAIHLAKAALVPKETTIVSLETSSQKGGPVKMGAGVIIRVGDRTSVFDSAGTARLLEVAKVAEIPHQRALMQGGTCEATAYALYGYTTVAMCVALGNYHNCGPGNQIAPEYVSVADAIAMTELCTALSRSKPADPHTALRRRLEKRMKEYRGYF